MQTTVCVQADAGLFLGRLCQHADLVGRPPDAGLARCIQHLKSEEFKAHSKPSGGCGVDPLALILSLRHCTCKDALVFMDVCAAEHWAAEAFAVWLPRTYFNPTNNQAMGWSIPAALGAQRAFPGRQTVTLTGDGCFLMTAMEICTAAREGLPVKFFVLDDQAFHYMQVLQKSAYRRTTATVLARLDYAALAQGFGVAYQEIRSNDELEAGILGALQCPAPVLVRVVTDYGKRAVRWIEAVRHRFIKELSTEQKVRFMARLGGRALDFSPRND
jgi:acetolactate synthase-1/2/3 large subunit